MMIEKLITTKTINNYCPNIYNYSWHYEATEFKTIKELLAFYDDCEDHGISWNGTDNYVYHHFPAFSRDREIYRVSEEESN